MSLLLPLGFLGLIGLAVLLLIYIIKPNYQQKLISSTFVWKLSLKYQKNKLPISKLKNILLLLMQVLIIVLCAFIMTDPVINNTVEGRDEVVIILDASASMLVTGSEQTNRFDRAVEQARAVASETFDKDGMVTVILADEVSDYTFYRVDSSKRIEVYDKLSEYADGACTYGSADIDGAITLATEVVDISKEARVILFTGTDYTNHGLVDVRNVALDDGSEFNVAVLDLRAEKTIENYYNFYVDLACYGRDMDVTLRLDLGKVNDGSTGLSYILDNDPQQAGMPIRLTNNRTTTVMIKSDVVIPDDRAKAVPVYSFDEATATVQIADSLNGDNMFSLFGNTKPIINIQYASSTPNSFFAVAFMSLQNALKDRWTINYREIRPGMTAATTGYDLYVFEGNMIPQNLPTDGVVFFVNPPYLPYDTDLRISAVSYTDLVPLVAGEEHPITRNVFAGNIQVTRYSSIVSQTVGDDSAYTPLMYCQGNPVLVCRNTETSKIVVMSFSLNYSTAAVNYDFPWMILNTMNYYMPSTFDKNIFDVNDVITLNARGPVLELIGTGVNENIREFPQSLKLTNVGSYTATQTPISGKIVTEKFFVRIPANESNIVKVIDVLENRLQPFEKQQDLYDLCIYFAAVLVLLVVAERFLQSRSMS